MPLNRYPLTPIDKNNNPKVNYPPAVTTLASTHKENTGTSSVLLFTHNTTEIEVATTGLGVAGRWAANSATSVVATNASTGNWDFVVPVATVRRFVVPQSVVGSEYNGSVQGINRSAGLYQGVAYISLTGGNGSVLTAEFGF